MHVMAHVYAARAVVPGMAKRGSGYLLNTASAAGLLTSLPSATYAVTKHAAIALAEYLAIQQSGGMRIVASPYDDELAKLGVELESTVVACGTDKEQHVQMEKIAGAARLSEAPAAGDVVLTAVCDPKN